ncbi:MAG: DNA polymerase III subunit chi [Devosiaceae bacterium]
MAEVAFYHLQTTSLEAALPQLLAKCLQRDWRVVVECGAHESLASLDESLWTYSDAAFLPHARDGGEGVGEPGRQPIWLCANGGNPNGAKVRFFIEGALPTANDNLDVYERTILMFDGARDEAVVSARAAWKALRDAGHTLSYWKQSDSGAWQNMAG